MDYLVIDGYNVIGAWPQLKKTKDFALADARQKLVEILREYQAFTGKYIILVFDAYRSKGEKATTHLPGMEIRFTDYGQTADSLIESLVARLAEQNQAVGVVTSDWAQQQIVLGKGARRWSSREFYLEVKKIVGQIANAADSTALDRRTTELKNRIAAKDLKALQAMMEKDSEA